MTVAAAPDTHLDFKPSGWDLSELLPERSDALLDQRLAELEQAVAAFERRRPSLGPAPGAAELLAVLAEYEALVERTIALEVLASLWFAEDTQSTRAITFQSRLQQALARASNRTLFFELWWKGLGEREAEALLPRAAEHRDYAHFLAELRRFRPHTLDERSEQIVTLKDANGKEALLTLYSVLTNRLEFQLEIDGRRQTLTRDELGSHVHSPRREVREAAYRELYRVYGREATPLAQIYAARVRDWYQEYVGLRGFASPIAVRNLANDLPDAAVETLLDVIAEHAPLFQRYFRLKASWLGLPKLRRYDLYAPLAEADHEIPYGQAVRLVLDTFEAFDPRFAQAARRVFDQGHVDSAARRGKRAGAFCATALPRQTPWVLLHYTDKLRDVTTLAHELGHAVHSVLAAGHSVLTQRASLPLAETASVFAEMLVTERLLALESDCRARRDLLLTAMDNVYATVLRQASFVRFEIEAHRQILAGRSPEELNALYLGNLAEQFGDSVEVAPEFQHEWLSIPHLYNTPFYCYAYSFGQLLVLALYRRYQQQGEAFRPGYLKLLAYGGSARPLTILAEAGVDPCDPAFWRGGFEVIREMLDELAATLPSSGA
jgi:oligoendopeptidase F